MGGWPYNENDEMEIGTTGWIPIGEGSFMNKYNNHIIDSIGREYDEDGNLIYDPNAKKDAN